MQTKLLIKSETVFSVSTPLVIVPSVSIKPRLKREIIHEAGTLLEVVVKGHEALSLCVGFSPLTTRGK